MAKMFLNMDETKALLGTSEDDVKQFVKDGKLREFRDGAIPKYKADQVENLKRDIAATGADSAIDLAADESLGEISLADTGDTSDSTAGGLDLSDSKTGSKSGLGTKSGTGSKVGSKAGTGAAGTGSGTAAPDDTALATDLGLSGSVSGVPSSGRVASTAGGLSGSQASRSGVDIFHDDAEKADPSAQTSVAPGLSGEAMNIESAGSGSGLLDLTRESDDTSLGAEILDDIAPGASGTRRPPTESAGGSAIGSGMSEPPSTSIRAPLMPVEAPDPLAPAFGLAAVGAAVSVLFAVFAIVCGMSGSRPDILAKMGSTATGGYSFLIVLGAFFVLPVILFVTGMVTGKGGRR
jgi:hypothetical protein